MRFFVVELRMPDGSVLFQARVPGSALEATLTTCMRLLLHVSPSLNVQDGGAYVHLRGT